RGKRSRQAFVSGVLLRRCTNWRHRIAVPRTTWRARCSKRHNGRKARKQPPPLRRWRRAVPKGIRRSPRLCGSARIWWGNGRGAMACAARRWHRPPTSAIAPPTRPTLLAGLDEPLRQTFPDYAAFARPTPLSVEEVQAELRPDEALVLFLDTLELEHTPEDTFIWVVTKLDVRWVRSDVGRAALQREVAA